MNTKLLIDAIVRHTTVLIAQLATAAGVRAPLAHVANQVFLELVRKLEEQGVRQKVIADMFGLALRTYQMKVQRLLASATDRDTTLWEAIFTYLQDNQVVTRADVLRRFRNDDEAMVRGILQDLVSTGLVFKTGSGHNVAFRPASDAELSSLDETRQGEDAAAFIWLLIYRNGPIKLTDLQTKARLDEAELDALLTALTTEGRICSAEEDGELVYQCDRFIVPLGSPIGWEAAVFDHYQALVAAIQASLRRDDESDNDAIAVGGSTYSFDIWKNHPHEDDVRQLLTTIRETVAKLRTDVFDYNGKAQKPAEFVRVTFYAGQSAKSIERDAENGE